jgi:hypothetical protein
MSNWCLVEKRHFISHRDLGACTLGRVLKERLKPRPWKFTEVIDEKGWVMARCL